MPLSDIPSLTSALDQPQLRLAPPRSGARDEPPRSDLSTAHAGDETRFGHNLARYREGAEVSQEELSFRASIHRTEVSLLERGEPAPR